MHGLVLPTHIKAIIYQHDLGKGGGWKVSANKRQCMKKVAFGLMCVLSVFISCGDEDDDHHHHHDSNDFSFRSELKQQQEGSKVCLSSESVQPISSEPRQL